MHNAVQMSRVNRPCDVLNQCGGVAGCDTMFFGVLSKGSIFQEFHREIRDIRMLPDFKNLHNARMSNCSTGLRFGEKSDNLFLSSELRIQNHLQRDTPMKL